MGATSLSAEQQASEITGNNLANVNNPTYSREQLVMQSALPVDTPIGQEGTGVDASSIQQFRDAYVDSQVVSQTSVTSSYTAQQSTLQNAEIYLDEQLQAGSATDSTTNSPNGLSANISNLFNQFSGLTTSNTQAAAGTTIADAQNLAKQFNQVSASLSNIQGNTNQSVQTGVAAANQDLATIAGLNQQIAVATASGGTADALVDQRQTTLQNLASYVNFSSSTESNGSVDVSIGGVSMVAGVTTPDQLQTFTNSSGNLMVQAQNAGTPLTITGGSIGGNITARDGALATLQSGLDAVASNLITQVNTVYNASTGENFFTGADASDIAVNSSVGASDLNTAVSNDGSLASNLANLATTPISSLKNQTLQASYDSTVSGLGDSIDIATGQLNSNQTVAQMLSNQQSSVSGVNTDEEMTNLIEFQKAYEASAELISTVSNMLETVIDMAYES